MSTETELRTFLVSDLATVLTTAFPTADGDIYFDRQTHSKRERSEVCLTIQTRPIEENDTGHLYAHTVTIELFKAQYEPYWQTSFRSGLEEAARTVVDAYHNAIDVFQAAITLDVDYVTCQQVGPITETDRNEKDRSGISQIILLEVGTWES